MYDRVLVPFDGSPTAAAVAPYAAWLAKEIQATVELLIVTPSRAGLLRAMSPLYEDTDDQTYASIDAARLEEVRAEFHARAQRTVDDQAEVLRLQGATVTTRVMEGDPSERLVEASRNAPDSIIAMATHGRAGIQRWFVGSVTTKVMREAHCPVLVIRPREEVDAPIASKEIVVPLDGSELAETALPHATGLASKLDVPVHLVRAATLSGLGYGFVEDGPLQYGDLVDNAVDVAKDYVAAIADNLRSQGVGTVTTSVVDKDPDEAIIDAVGPNGDRLVVMTTHGRTGLNRFVVGSVTDKVVRSGAGPVLVVPSLER